MQLNLIFPGALSRVKIAKIKDTSTSLLKSKKNQLIYKTTKKNGQLRTAYGNREDAGHALAVLRRVDTSV